MLLESLSQGAGTIHELNLDGAFPERAPYRPRELYAALKATPLYDPERGQWNWSMSEEQILKLADYGADSQLLGVLVEAQFNPEGAWQLYEKVKATPLYDAGRGQWNDYLSGKQTLEYTFRHAVAQLFGVLVEAQFNPEAARERYGKLTATPLYDVDRGQWNWSMSEGQMLLGTDRNAAAQLVGVLVEAQFDPANAQVRYEQLKATPLYDAGRGQWSSVMSKEQVLCDSVRSAAAQLLGVLVEATLLSTLPRALAEPVPPLPVMENW